MSWVKRHYAKIWVGYTIAVVVAWFVPVPIPYFSVALLIGFVILCAVWYKLIFSVEQGASSEFLCDSCKFNHGDVCRRPERPNATECPDYKSR